VAGAGVEPEIVEQLAENNITLANRITPRYTGTGLIAGGCYVAEPVFIGPNLFRYARWSGYGAPG